MKVSFYFTALVVVLFMSCSVDSEISDLNTDSINEHNLYTSVCEPGEYEIFSGTSLIATVYLSNDNIGEEAIIYFDAEDGYTISSIKEALVYNVDDFPQNNGGIIEGQLTKIDYPNLESVTRKFNLTANNFYYTAKINFLDINGNIFSLWVGDKYLGSKASSYLFYEVCIPSDEPVCTAGKDNSVTLKNAYVRDYLYGVSLLEKYYLSMLDEDVPKNGTFTPSIYSITRQYKENNYQTFETTYTITEGCVDSAKLSITVIP